ncbi:MAG: hypothetical protein MI867_12550 [Pseudomonadales bacterium]|nr:hypothetical protein [Pseudomonadales bacterium]
MIAALLRKLSERTEYVVSIYTVNADGAVIHNAIDTRKSKLDAQERYNYFASDEILSECPQHKVTLLEKRKHGHKVIARYIRAYH